MSLPDWRDNGWVVEHRTSREEIASLLALADRDLRDCRARGVSPDWRLAIAWNAALQSATAALAASGYRASREGHHFRVIQSLALTLGVDQETVRSLDRFRKKRNLSDYQRAGSISEQEVAELVALAEGLRKDVAKWLRREHPGLVGG